MLNYMSQAAVNALAEEIGDVLTVSEAAGVMRCSLVTIYRAVENGEIKNVIRLGGQRGMRIPVASFREYVNSKRIAAQPSQFDPVQLAEPTAA